MTNQMGASLSPDEFQGGGLMDDVDVTWTKVEFAEWDYGGQTKPRLALAITMNTDGGQDFTQYYSAGDLEHFAPSKDGKRAVPKGDKTKLHQSTNAAQLIASVVNAGFPKDRLSDDASVFEGLKCHMVRQAQPARRNMPGQQPGKEQSILAVSRIISLPGVKKAGPTAVVASSNGAYQKAVKVVTDLLAKGEPVKAATLPQAAFKALVKDKDRNEVVQLLSKPDFLGGEEQPWMYDGTVLIGAAD